MNSEFQSGADDDPQGAAGRPRSFATRRNATKVVPIKSLALFVFTIALSLVGLETFLGLFDHYYRTAPAAEAKAESWSAIVHRPSRVPGLTYELAPNLSVHSRFGFVRTNSLGMRDDEPLPASTPGLLRIAAVGDSFTFGLRVNVEDSYPSVLERMLSAVDSPRPVDVLNLGVSGYSTAEEASVIRYRAIPLAPRLIVLGYVLNDPETHPIQPLHEYFTRTAWYRQFHLTRLGVTAWQHMLVMLYGNGDYVTYLHAPSGPAWPSVIDAFGEINRATRKAGIPVLVVVFPIFPAADWRTYSYAPIHRQVVAAARNAGFDALDLLNVYRRYRPEELWALPTDMHPSALGHRIAATEILKKLTADYPRLLATR